ncbi:nuclear transport factor 2 family protein [Seonamhaeicola algicola]|uniref:Nuclear transport factor 2 family protein n=1 Tax=Seonamhaeicola algicola TaxID=1719036 RepID=A0A5C7AZ73_9FLAO|nr:nuclear transport factor 2 family protein [Seonamhaeicola algicola]TXE13811.1 nuclear transport factor 2 family protein [Seonamhaeicola algicola]
MRLIKHALIIGITIFSINTYAQQKERNTMTNQEIVTKFLNGFNNPELIQESIALLADDYKFKNPMVELNSKKEFIALAQEMGKVLTGVNVIHVADNGDWLAAFYEFKSSIPGLESNFGTEWFRIENGKIKESHLIYDASEWRKVYEQMGE